MTGPLKLIAILPPKEIADIVRTELQALYRQWRDELEAKLQQILDRYPDHPYHPHLTLAHRDVLPNLFAQIWSHYQKRSFDTNFTISGFWILDHAQNGWEPETAYHFRHD